MKKTHYIVLSLVLILGCLSLALLLPSPMSYAEGEKVDFIVHHKSSYSMYLSFYEKKKSSVYCNDSNDFGDPIYVDEENGQVQRIPISYYFKGGDNDTVLQMDKGRQFCIKLQPGDGTGGHNFYQGPYSIGKECAFEAQSTIKPSPKTLVPALYVTKGCLPDNYAHNDVSQSLTDAGWIGDYVLEVYERGTSRDCDNHSNRGKLLINSALFVGLDYYFATEANTEFCVYLKGISDYELGNLWIPEVDFYYGPFKAGEAINITENESARECKIHITNNKSHTDEGCKAPGFITINNLVEGYETDVSFYEKGSSPDCSDNSGRGELIEKTSISTGYSNIRLNDGQIFCVETRGDIHAGPYEANKDCDLTLSSSFTISASPGCGLVHVPANVTFNNNDSRNYDITLRALGNSTSCSKDSDRGGALMSTFKLKVGNNEATTKTIEDKWFCLATEHGSDQRYFGPFEAQDACTINISAQGVAELSANCDDIDKTVDVQFEHMSQIEGHDVEIVIYEKGGSFDCKHNTNRGHISAVFELEENVDPVSVQTSPKNNYTGQVTDQFCITVDGGHESGPYLKSDVCTVTIHSDAHITTTASLGCTPPAAD